MNELPRVIDDVAAFPILQAADLALLESLGTRRSVTPGEYLYRQGDETYDFYVLLSGAVEIVVDTDGPERVIARHGAGRFLVRRGRKRYRVPETQLSRALPIEASSESLLTPTFAGSSELRHKNRKKTRRVA